MDSVAVEKLLKGRKLIDEHLQRKEVYSKLNRGLYDLFHKEYAEELYRELREMGFGDDGEDNEVTNFMLFNQEMVKQMVRECVPIEGYCDECNGNLDPKTKKPTGPICEKVYGTKFCSQKDIDNKTVPDWMYTRLTEVMKDEAAGKTRIKENKGKSRGCCPEGHGFFVVDSKRKVYPFEPFWGKNYTKQERDVLKVKYKHQFTERKE